MGKFITHQRIMKMYKFCKLVLYAVLLRGYSSGQMTATASTTEQKRYHHHHHHHVVSSPEDMGIRPDRGLDEVPFIDLIEMASPLDDPRPTDLNTTALHLKLGPNYEPAVMSVHPPSLAERQDLSYFGFRRNRLGRLIPTGTMPAYLSKMDFKYLRLPNGSKLRTKISPKLKRKIQQFLWAYTACPVIYRWKDLGVRFWPRYLKIGFCPQNGSCSVPPGMTCRPSDSTNKTLLRWYCKNSYGSSDGGNNDNNAVSTLPHRHCQWIKADYPVLTECTCSCGSAEADNNY